MAVSFKKHWSEEISEVTKSSEFQTCTVEIIDPSKVVGGSYNYDTGAYSEVTDAGVIYSGAARFIPIRAGVSIQGEDQSNSTTLRTVRFQLQDSAPSYVGKGMFLRITAAPHNDSLVGRTAKVEDDFQGGSRATRTIHAVMDIDSGVERA